MYIASIESSKKNHDLSSTAFYQWHNRLRHHAHNTVKSIMISCNVPPNNKMHYAFCSAYCLGTIHNFPFPLSSNEYSSPLQLIRTYGLHLLPPAQMVIVIIFTLLMNAPTLHGYTC